MLTQNVADGIHRLEHAYVNMYLVEDGQDVAIIDAGLPAVWQYLEAALRKLGYRREQVKALVLTHAHFDHLGTAARIRAAYRVPILVHPDDQYIAAHPYRYKHEKSRLLYPFKYPAGIPPQFSMVGAGALWVRGVTDVHALTEGPAAALPGTPDIIPTPGHTAGHVALHFRDRNALICGDSLVTFNPYTGMAGPQIVSGAATANSGQALESLSRLANTGARTLLTGHGDPWTSGADAAVERALQAGAS